MGSRTGRERTEILAILCFFLIAFNAFLVNEVYLKKDLAFGEEYERKILPVFENIQRVLNDHERRITDLER